MFAPSHLLPVLADRNDMSIMNTISSWSLAVPSMGTLGTFPQIGVGMTLQPTAEEAPRNAQGRQEQRAICRVLAWTHYPWALHCQPVERAISRVFII